jgi:hypothetical protein
MTIFNVHIYREMRIVFEDIEADSHEAAAAIARDRPTSDAIDDIDCEGESLSALVDVAGDEEYTQSRYIDFEGERQRKAAPKLLAACRMVVERWERGDLAEAARACSAAIDDVDTPMQPADRDPAKKPYSILLLYPEDVNDSGTETYYTFVEAPDAIEAVAAAKREAVAAQGEDLEYDPDDFAPLLVIQGHHYGQPMFNK